MPRSPRVKAFLDIRTSLRSRLLLGMGVMLLPIVALAVLGFVSSRAMVDAIEEVVREQNRELHPVATLQRLVLQAGMPVNDYLLTGDTTERAEFDRLARDADAQLAGLAAGDALDTPDERRLLGDVAREWRSARALGLELLAVPRPLGDATVAARMKVFDAHVEGVSDALAGLYDQVVLEVAAHEARSRVVRSRVTVLLLAVSLLSFVLAGGAAVLLSRSIVVPVRALQDGILRFAEGDHSFRVPLRGADELAQVADTMNRLADRLEHDQLTGVASRGALQRRLPAEIAWSRRFDRPFSLLMVDVDHFKRVNDEHGHPAGDRALRAVAARLAHGLRAVDTVARYGGEEFALVLPETPAAGARILAERLRAAVAADPVTVGDDRALHLTVSVGVATYPADAGDEAALVAAADRALYAAKRWGRDRVVAAADVDATREGAPGAEEPAAAAGGDPRP